MSKDHQKAINPAKHTRLTALDVDRLMSDGRQHTTPCGPHLFTNHMKEHATCHA